MRASEEDAILGRRGPGQSWWQKKLRKKTSIVSEHAITCVKTNFWKLNHKKCCGVLRSERTLRPNKMKEKLSGKNPSFFVWLVGLGHAMICLNIKSGKKSIKCNQCNYATGYAHVLRRKKKKRKNGREKSAVGGRIGLGHAMVGLNKKFSITNAPQIRPRHWLSKQHKWLIKKQSRGENNVSLLKK